MISWAKVILGLLSLVESLSRWAQESKLISEGEKLEIARRAALLDELLGEKKAIKEDLDAKSDKELDDHFERLGTSNRVRDEWVTGKPVGTVSEEQTSSNKLK